MKTAQFSSWLNENEEQVSCIHVVQWLWREYGLKTRIWSPIVDGTSQWCPTWGHEASKRMGKSKEEDIPYDPISPMIQRLWRWTRVRTPSVRSLVLGIPSFLTHYPRCMIYFRIFVKQIVSITSVYFLVCNEKWILKRFYFGKCSLFFSYSKNKIVFIFLLNMYFRIRNESLLLGKLLSFSILLHKR